MGFMGFGFSISSTILLFGMLSVKGV